MVLKSKIFVPLLLPLALVFILQLQSPFASAQTAAIPGDYLVEVSSPCDTACQNEVVSAFRASNGASCSPFGPQIRLTGKILINMVCPASLGVASAASVPAVDSSLVQQIIPNERIVLERRLPILPCVEGDIQANIQHEVKKKKKSMMDHMTSILSEGSRPFPITSPCMSESPSVTPSPSSSPSPSVTPSSSSSPSPSSSPTPSSSPSPSKAPAPSNSPVYKKSVSPAPSSSPGESVIPTPSSSPEESVNPTPSSSPEESVSFTPSSSPEESVSPTPSNSPEESVSPTPSSSPIYGETVDSGPINLPTDGSSLASSVEVAEEDEGVGSGIDDVVVLKDFQLVGDFGTIDNSERTISVSSGERFFNVTGRQQLPQSTATYVVLNFNGQRIEIRATVTCAGSFTPIEPPVTVTTALVDTGRGRPGIVFNANLEGAYTDDCIPRFRFSVTYYRVPPPSPIAPPTPSATSSPASPSPSSSIIPFPSDFGSRSPSPSMSPSITPSMSPSQSPTPSISVTPVPSTSPSVTPSLSVSASVTASPSMTASPTPSASVSSSVTASPSFSSSTTPSPSFSSSLTPSPSFSSSVTPSPSLTPSVSVSASVTPSLSVSASVTPSVSVSASMTPSASVSASVSASITISPSPSPSRSPAPVPWGVDEVDGNDDGQYGCTSSNRGEGIHVLVVDSGCEPMNGGLCDSWPGYAPAGTCPDGNGHGTHVAGTIGDPIYGIASKAKISCYKVFPSSGGGTTAAVYAAFDFARENDVDVINLSLGLPGAYTSTYFDNEVIDIANYPKWVVNAAGNDNIDACTSSPSRAIANTLYKVQAHDSRGNSAWFTNYGECTDISAPGVYIPSLSNNGNNPSYKSGTSMAAPHVAGMIAQLISDGRPPILYTLTENGFTVNTNDGSTIDTLGVNC